jgi:anti-anti-sigma factor
MANEMRCRVAATPGGHVVFLAGEIDLASAPALAETLVQFATGDITVDFADVTFIDCSGVNALVAAQRHIERRQGRLFVQRANPMTRRIFDLTGLDKLLCTNGGCNTPRSAH